MYSCMSFELVKGLFNHVVRPIGLTNVVKAKRAMALFL